jgi:uncharacterized membrane protein YozB (DUF420 family)
VILLVVGVELTDSKTTIAVSVSVISVAVVVICTVLGLYLYKKRKTKRELEEASQQGMSFSTLSTHLLLTSSFLSSLTPIHCSSLYEADNR